MSRPDFELTPDEWNAIHWVLWQWDGTDESAPEVLSPRLRAWANGPSATPEGVIADGWRDGRPTFNDAGGAAGGTPQPQEPQK